MYVKATTVLALVAVALMATSCTTVRTVDGGDTAYRENVQPPTWAMRNAKMADASYVYFVGISQEQATSESAAIQQAYMDAMRRVADHIGVWLHGNDEFGASTEADASTDWAHRIPARLKGNSGPFGRSSDGDWDSDDENAVVRDQLIGLVEIEDTWTIRETFWNEADADPVRLNYMKYGELWKAKVLVRAPREELMARAHTEYGIRMREVDLLFQPVVAEKPTFSFIEDNYVSATEVNQPKGTHFVGYGPRKAPVITQPAPGDRPITVNPRGVSGRDGGDVELAPIVMLD